MQKLVSILSNLVYQSNSNQGPIADDFLEKMMNLTFKIEEEQEENNDKNIDHDDDDPTAMTVNDFMALQKSK